MSGKLPAKSGKASAKPENHPAKRTAFSDPSDRVSSTDDDDEDPEDLSWDKDEEKEEEEEDGDDEDKLNENEAKDPDVVVLATIERTRRASKPRKRKMLKPPKAKVSLYTRLKEFPDESLEIAPNGRLFCQCCGRG